MPIVTWCDEYNVNVEEIDNQHQKMLELVNNVHAAVEARINKDDLTELLVTLVEFTRMHFSTEEQLSAGMYCGSETPAERFSQCVASIG